MATYTELRGLFNDGPLQNKIDVAVVIAANNLISGAPTANDRAWAAAVFANPRTEAKKAFQIVLAENNVLTVAAIQAATDAAIQTNVDGAVSTLVDAFNAV